MLIEKAGLFGERKTLEEALQYTDDLVTTLRPQDRTTAYTAAYVLYNTIVELTTTNRQVAVSERSEASLPASKEK